MMYNPKEEPIEIKDPEGRVKEVIGHIAACRTWRLNEKGWVVQSHVKKAEKK